MTIETRSHLQSTALISSEYIHNHLIQPTSMITRPLTLILRLPSKKLLFRGNTPPQSNPIITRIRRPQQRMDMKFGRLLIIQEHTRMVIKLYNHHRTLDTIVERVFGAKSSYPTKVSFVCEGHCVGEFLGSGGSREVEVVFFEDGRDEVLLGG
jgi:hypothetical protein